MNRIFKNVDLIEMYYNIYERCNKLNFINIDDFITQVIIYYKSDTNKTMRFSRVRFNLQNLKLDNYKMILIMLDGMPNDELIDLYKLIMGIDLYKIEILLSYFKNKKLNNKEINRLKRIQKIINELV